MPSNHKAPAEATRLSAWPPSKPRTLAPGGTSLVSRQQRPGRGTAGPELSLFLPPGPHPVTTWEEAQLRWAGSSLGLWVTDEGGRRGTVLESHLCTAVSHQDAHSPSRGGPGAAEELSRLILFQSHTALQAVPLPPTPIHREDKVALVAHGQGWAGLGPRGPGCSAHDADLPRL